MTAFEGVEACVFDAYGTLFDLHSALAPHLDTLGERADPLGATWRAKQLEYTWLRSLMHDAWIPFERIVADALDYALESAGIDDPPLRERLLRGYRELAPYPEVPAVLRALKAAGIRAAILSNGSREMLDAAVEAAGLAPWLDAVLSVDEVRVFKPHPRVYGLVLERFGLAPGDAGRVSFQSASSWDAVGAARFGFDVVWCNRGGAPAERLDARPGAAVRSLDELPAVLGIARPGSPAEPGRP